MPFFDVLLFRIETLERRSFHLAPFSTRYRCNGYGLLKCFSLSQTPVPSPGSRFKSFFFISSRFVSQVISTWNFFWVLINILFSFVIWYSHLNYQKKRKKVHICFHFFSWVLYVGCWEFQIYYYFYWSSEIYIVNILESWFLSLFIYKHQGIAFIRFSRPMPMSRRIIYAAASSAGSSTPDSDLNPYEVV